MTSHCRILINNLCSPMGHWENIPLPQWENIPLPQWENIPVPQWGNIPVPQWGNIPTGVISPYPSMTPIVDTETTTGHGGVRGYFPTGVRGTGIFFQCPIGLHQQFYSD